MRVTQKGQVTIPKWARDRFGIRPGAEVRFREEDNRVILEKATSKIHPFDAVYGLLGKKGSSDKLVRALRGA